MARPDTRYLKRQWHRWYFYLAVPQDLRGRFMSEGRRGKRGQRDPGRPRSKIVVSLHTQSLQEAQLRRWPLVQHWQEEFERARTGAPLTLAEIDAIARESYAAVLVAMDANTKRRHAPRAG